MTCCTSSSSTLKGLDRFFSKHAKKYVTRFRKKGLAKEQRMLIEGITRSPLAGRSILEIGCGVGALHLTLLQHGALRATGVDAAEEMLNQARILSRELGKESQTDYMLGDFVALRESVPEFDITVLDKVVCCYEKVEELLASSLARTGKVYALSFPRNTLLMKSLMHVPIIIGKLLRWSFRPYWHDWEAMIRKIEEAGFAIAYTNQTVAWSVYVFMRTTS